MARQSWKRTRCRTDRDLCNEAAIGKIDDVEKAVSDLSPEELERFRAWFEAFDAERFDEMIERDAKAGKLDALIERARANH